MQARSRATRAIIGMCAIGALFASPALAQQYPVTNGDLSVNESTKGGSIAAGESFVVAGGGYAPGAEVQITVGSVPTVLGVTIANEAGEINTTVSLPSQYAGATHQINATGAAASGGILVLGIQVTIAAQTTPTTRPSSPTAAQAVASDDQLAFTGSSSALVGGAGLALCVAGGALVLYRKRSLTEA